MINPPKLNNAILEKLYLNQIISDDDLKEVLAFDKTLLIEDCHAIISFCGDFYDGLDIDSVIDEVDDNISYNLLIYSFFLLKEIDAKNQLNLILDFLRWEEPKIHFWFSDLITVYTWSLVYHFGLLEIDKLVLFLKEENIDTFSKEQVAMAIYQIYLHNPYSENIIADYWTELLEFYNKLAEESAIMDETYLAFFVSYISKPSDYQTQLIKNLYDMGYIDESINGRYQDFLKITEPKGKILNIFDVNKDLIGYEKNESVNYSSKIFEDFDNYNLKPLIVDKKINRNDPCPCGSGNKYKKCCLN